LHNLVWHGVGLALGLCAHAPNHNHEPGSCTAHARTFTTVVRESPVTRSCSRIRTIRTFAVSSLSVRPTHIQRKSGRRVGAHCARPDCNLPARPLPLSHVAGGGALARARAPSHCGLLLPTPLSTAHAARVGRPRGTPPDGRRRVSQTSSSSSFFAPSLSALAFDNLSPQ